MNEFHQTRMGQQFYEGTMREVSRSLQSISNELKRANDLKERELALLENNQKAAAEEGYTEEQQVINFMRANGLSQHLQDSVSEAESSPLPYTLLMMSNSVGEVDLLLVGWSNKKFGQFVRWNHKEISSGYSPLPKVLEVVSQVLKAVHPEQEIKDIGWEFKPF